MTSAGTIPLRRWLPALVAVPFILLLAAFVWWNYRQTMLTVERNAYERVTYRMLDEQRRLEALLRVHANSQIEEEITQLASLPQVVALALVDHQGRVLFSPQRQIVGHEMTDVLADFEPTLLRQVQEGRRLLLTFDVAHNFLLAYQPIALAAAPGQIRSSTEGVLLMKYDLATNKAEALRLSLITSLIAIACTLLLMVILTMTIRRWLSQPLAHLLDAVDRIGQADFSTAVNIAGRGELFVLAAAINHMQATLNRSNSQLRASETNLSITLNSIGDAVIATDTLGLITRMNPAAERLTGWSLTDAMGQPLLDVFCIINAQMRLPVTNPVHLVMERGEVIGLANHTVLLARDGHEYQIADSAAPIRDYTGNIVGVVLVFSDVTEKYQTEVALKQSAERLSLAARAGRVGIWEWDVTLNKTIWDDIMYQLYGIAADQFGGKYEAWRAGVHPEDREQSDAEIQMALRGEKEYDTEFRVIWPDGSIHNIRALAIVQRDENGQPLKMIGINWDITEKTKTEQTIQTALKEKTALLNEVHHRVKNNLQVITSLLRLEAGRSSQPDTKAMLGDMQGRIRSMALLHETLYRSGTFAEVDLGSYLKQLATQSFRALLTDAGSVRLHLDLASVKVSMDQATPCGLIVNELISNSLKHGFPDGRSGEVRIALQVIAGSQQVRLSVSDTGIGLPDDFDVRQKNSLGLQLVNSLATQLGGNLTVEPGAVFTVIFTAKTPEPTTMGP